MAVDEHHDVVIVGGGPAGVSAALECFDVQLDVVVLEASARLGGQLADIPNSIRNVAAGRFADGETLRGTLVASAEILDDRAHLSHRITSFDATDRWVQANGRRFQGDALLIASGTTAQFLPAAPDGAFGGDVTYVLEPGSDRFKGRVVAVVGGGDSGTLDALELAQQGCDVKLIHRSPRLAARRNILERIRAEPKIDVLAGWELERLQGSTHLEEVTLVRKDTDEHRTIEVGGLVVRIARLPTSDLWRDQLEVDEHEALVVDRKLQTSRLGVYAAGDVVSGSYARVAVAFGQGVLAARSMLRHVEDR